MFTCRVFNVWSNNSAYVVEFKSIKDACNFKIRKEADEYVDRVKVTRPTTTILGGLWRWFGQLHNHLSNPKNMY